MILSPKKVAQSVKKDFQYFFGQVNERNEVADSNPDIVQHVDSVDSAIDLLKDINFAGPNDVGSFIYSAEQDEFLPRVQKYASNVAKADMNVSEFLLGAISSGVGAGIIKEAVGVGAAFGVAPIVAEAIGVSGVILGVGLATDSILGTHYVQQIESNLVGQLNSIIPSL